MISLKIDNIKNFTSHLLVKDTFCTFDFVDCQICTHSTFSINGRTNAQYYSNDEQTSPGEFNSWEIIRPICYEIIKGKNLPTSFKFVLKLNLGNTKLLLQNLPDYTITDINGLFINIRYESGTIMLITGTSLSTFTLDKTPDKVFDTYITQFLDKNSIEYSIC